MRGRFNAVDGQLYVCGLGGWQTDTVKEGGFDRVRYTGKPIYSVQRLRVTTTGVELSFTQPLEVASATDPQNFSVKRWNYERAEHYGSPKFSVVEPTKAGKDSVEVTGAKLSAGGKVINLELADVRPVMQQAIAYRLKAADGTLLAQEIQHTIHVVPGAAESKAAAIAQTNSAPEGVTNER
jgi:hypothetical protein